MRAPSALLIAACLFLAHVGAVRPPPGAAAGEEHRRIGQLVERARAAQRAKAAADPTGARGHQQTTDGRMRGQAGSLGAWQQPPAGAIPRMTACVGEGGTRPQPTPRFAPGAP
jgi:hypothetical protein